MSMAREFISSKCINTRKPKSSSLFGAHINNKKQKYIKKRLMYLCKMYQYKNLLKKQSITRNKMIFNLKNNVIERIDKVSYLWG